MMKALLTHIIRQRNPYFILGSGIDNRMIYGLIMSSIFSMLRGLRVVLKGKRPNGLLLGKNVIFQNTHKLRFGKFLKLGHHVTIQALGVEGVKIGNHVSIGDYSKLVVCTTLNNLGKHISIGNNVGIGEFAYLGGAGGLTIGNDCIIGQYFSCHPENHNFNDRNELIKHQGVKRSGIVIGKNCWIGAKVTILDGVLIGDNCVIAAGAVVTKSFESCSVIGGVPASRIKSTYDQKIDSFSISNLNLNL